MEKLIVPVYLNQRLVFDLLAMLQGGISTVTAVTKIESSNISNQDIASATFGLSEAFSSLLRIDLSGKKTRSTSGNDENRMAEERVHTPASLFYQLRNILLEKDVLKILSEKVTPEPGDMVEFEASLKRNPVIETLDSMAEMMGMAPIFIDKPSEVKGQKRNSQETDYQKLQKQISAFSASLKSGNTIDLTAENLSAKHSAVITVETQFLNDPLMSDLVDGKFRVLGKVIRTINDDSESISLIRKAAISKMPSSIIEQAFGGLAALSTDQGFGTPEMFWEVTGPAIQIIPVAIYA
jgi:hypothetical protein